VRENEASRTALLMSYLRGYHAAHDAPTIFDDSLAHPLLPEAQRASFDEQFTPSLQAIASLDPAFAASRPDAAARLRWCIKTSLPLSLAVSRARFAEDCLEDAVTRRTRQYVILGAGLDTFAFRQLKVAGQLEVFEVDHPVTQALKRRYLAEAGWEIPARLHFVPVDLARERLAPALLGSRYDPQVLSFFSWLGVTMYLTREEVFTSLGAIAQIAPAGSTIVFDYLDADAYVPGRATRRIQDAIAYTQQCGEPMKSGLDPSSLAADLAPLGLRLHENFSPADIERRYFEARADGYHAYDHAHIARAVVES
jgi:methyltransferase (TIGR00027 family)